MQQQKKRRLPGLDTLRALAIVAVMLFHLQSELPEVLSPIAHFGWMGVDLFFVLSGYLIGSQLLKPYLSGETPSLQDFYYRRLLRIVPLYLVVLTLYFAVPGWREDPAVSPLWQFLTFTENVFVDYSIHPAFSHVWSLCVEEHFYLLFPLCVITMMRKPTVLKTTLVMTGLVFLGMAIRAFVLFHDLKPLGEDNFQLYYIEHIYYPTWTRLDGLLAGVATALIRTFRPVFWRSVVNRGHSTLIAGFILFTLCLWLFNNRMSSLTGAAAWGTVVGFPLLSIAFALLVASAISTNGWLSRASIPGMRALATLAFSLYLTHKAIAHLTSIYLPSLTGQRDLRSLVLYAATCLTAAAMFYLCVERPFLILRDRGISKFSANDLPSLNAADTTNRPDPQISYNPPDR